MPRFSKEATSGRGARRSSTSTKDFTKTSIQLSSSPFPLKEEDDHSNSCTICQEPVGIRSPEGVVEQWAVLPCGHLFGGKCIKEWLGMSEEPRCPACRASMTHRVCGHPTLPRPLETHNPTRQQKLRRKSTPAPSPFDPRRDNFSPRHVSAERLAKPCAFCASQKFWRHIIRREGTSLALIPFSMIRSMFRFHFGKLEDRRAQWAEWREQYRHKFSVWWGQQVPVTAPARIPPSAAAIDGENERALQQALIDDANLLIGEPRAVAPVQEEAAGARIPLNGILNLVVNGVTSEASAEDGDGSQLRSSEEYSNPVEALAVVPLAAATVAAQSILGLGGSLFDWDD